MDKENIINMLQDLTLDRGVPRNIKISIEESIRLMQDVGPDVEKLFSVISILDDVGNDPNISIPARTNIWNVVSILENAVSSVSSNRI